MVRLSRWFLLGLALFTAACGGGGGSDGPGPQPGRSKWTVLVFMNAANDLSSFSKLNMNQMEKVAGSPDVRFVVQWKQVPTLGYPTQFNGTRRYLVKPDNTDQINSQVVQDMGTKVDMGQVSTLRDFVTWGKANYPADRYVLVVWNHGNGWMRGPQSDDLPTRGVSYDGQTGNSIQTWQLDGATQGLGMDILAFDASLMQMAEVAYEMRNNVPFIVGSEESPPGEGYPYDLVFGQFQANPTAPTATLSKAFVDAMLAYPPYATRKITQSVLRSSALGNVGEKCSALATTLIAHPELAAEIRAARAATQPFSSSEFTPRHYYDLVDFAQNLSSRVTAQDVKDACAAVVTAVNSSLVWEGHNSQSSGSRGLAIDLSNSAQFTPRATDYQMMQWATNTTWDEWLLIAP